MADLHRKMQEGHTVSDLDTVIDEVYGARGEYDSLGERLDSLPSEKDETEDRAALAEIIDSGPKNAIINTATSGTSFGVIFTPNEDGTVDVSGTASGGNAQKRLMTISAEDAQKFNGMVLSGCPAGGGSSTYRLVFQLDGSSYTTYAADTGDGAIISGVPASQCRIMIVVYDGTTIEDIFKPMICSKAEWDISQVYQPYRPPYQELYERVVALEQANGITRSVQAMKSAAEMPEETDPEGDGEEMR